MILDLVTLIKTVGYLGVFAIVYAESGLFVGFFLPGDSLLFTAGFLASQDVLSLPVLVVGCSIAAILGDSTGYTFGRRMGRRLFQKEDSFLFHKKNVLRAQAFYEKHGAKTIVLARFVPIVRTFAPIVAGIGEMRYRTFVVFNIFGGLLWGAGVTVAGYFLGSMIPDVDKYLLPLIFLIVFVSVLPALFHLLKDPDMRNDLVSTFKRVALRRPLQPETIEGTDLQETS